MKKQVAIEIFECDYKDEKETCNTTGHRHNIRECALCNKDFCGRHSEQVDIFCGGRKRVTYFFCLQDSHDFFSTLQQSFKPHTEEP